MEKSKEPIRLRKRVLKNGNTSLYLDIYMGGKRSYEFLNLYLVPEKTRADKGKNKETLKLADAVRAQRVVEFQNGRFGFDEDKTGQKRGNTPLSGLFVSILRIIPSENRIFWKNRQKSVA